jgi:hypothetical protein
MAARMLRVPKAAAAELVERWGLTTILLGHLGPLQLSPLFGDETFRIMRDAATRMYVVQALAEVDGVGLETARQILTHIAWDRLVTLQVSSGEIAAIPLARRLVGPSAEWSIRCAFSPVRMLLERAQCPPWDWHDHPCIISDAVYPRAHFAPTAAMTTATVANLEFRQGEFASCIQGVSHEVADEIERTIVYLFSCGA